MTTRPRQSSSARRPFGNSGPQIDDPPPQARPLAENRPGLTSCFPPHSRAPLACACPQRARQLISFLAEIGVLEAAWAPEPGASRRLSRDLALDPRRPPQPTASALVWPWNGTNGRIPRDAVLRLAASEYLQQAPSPSSSNGLAPARIARPDRLRSLAGGNWAQTCGIAGVRPGATGHRDQRPPSRKRSALNPAKLWWAGSTTPGATCWRCTAGWPPTGKRSIAELLADPHRHNESGLQEWSQAEAGELPQLAGVEERSQLHGDPRRFHAGWNSKASAWPRAGGIATGSPEQQAGPGCLGRNRAAGVNSP